MNKKIRKSKTKKQKNELLESVSAFIFGFWFFLLFLPVFFTFQTATITGKVFMIIGSVLFAGIQILLILFVEKLLKKDINEKKSLIQLRIFYIFSSIFYLFLLLRYIDDKIWGVYEIVVSIVFLLALLYGCFCIIKHFDFFFNNEKIPMLLATIAIFLFWLGGLLLESNTQTSYVLFKIAIGILYLIFIAIFLNLTVFNLLNVNNRKYKLLRILVCVAIPLIILMTIPFYVQWCGVSGYNFEIFVTVYSAVCGGGLTLIGVAWTIKQSDAQRRKEEIIKFKPYIVFSNSSKHRYENSSKKFCESDSLKFSKTDEFHYECRVEKFSLHNTDKAPYIFKGFLFNKQYILERKPDLYKNKDTYLNIDIHNISLFLKEPVNFLQLLLSDINYNLYTIDLNFNTTLIENEVTLINVIDSSNLKEYQGVV